MKLEGGRLQIQAWNCFYLSGSHNTSFIATCKCVMYWGHGSFARRGRSLGLGYVKEQPVTLIHRTLHRCCAAQLTLYVSLRSMFLASATISSKISWWSTDYRAKRSKSLKQLLACETSTAMLISGSERSRAVMSIIPSHRILYGSCQIKSTKRHNFIASS